MASDPIQIGGITWPNQFQKPTGIVAGAANPAMDPQNLNNSQIPADSSKVPYAAKGIDTVPSTDSTKGRVIDVRGENMKPVDQSTFDELRSNAERLFTEMKVRLDKADQKLLKTEKKLKELEKFIASLAEEAA